MTRLKRRANFLTPPVRHSNKRNSPGKELKMKGEKVVGIGCFAKPATLKRVLQKMISSCAAGTLAPLEPKQQLKFGRGADRHPAATMDGAGLHWSARSRTLRNQSGCRFLPFTCRPATESDCICKRTVHTAAAIPARLAPEDACVRPILPADGIPGTGSDRCWAIFP